MHYFSTLFWYFSMTNAYCCEYSIKTPDDGQYICPKHVEFYSKNKVKN